MRAIRQRGVTLVELLVALAASAIVLVGVLAAAKAQQEAYHGGQRVREAQGGARNALLFIEQKLAIAGYGMDPVLALDLSGQPGDPDPVPWYSGPCPVEAAPCVKDRLDGSDELVLHARNPSYWIAPGDAAPGSDRGRVWTATQQFNPASSPTTIRLAARTGDLFLRGQILQGVCDRGQGQVYFTVGENVGRGVGAGAQPLDADAEVVIPLAPEDVLTNPFRRQSAGRCIPSRFFQIDRYRFHVRPVRTGERFESYLVLDMGVDANRDGVIDENDEQVIAPGVEILQVAYHFTPDLDAIPAAPLPAVGTESGTPIAIVRGAPNAQTSSMRASPPGAADGAPNTIRRADFSSSIATDPDFYTLASLYPFRIGTPMAPERKTNYQGNIRAVQVALVTRSTSPVPDSFSSIQPGPLSPVLNMNVTPAWIAAGGQGGRDGFERIRLESTTHMPSMIARRLLYD